MYEYSINVSVNGLFLFRTDWDVDTRRAKEAVMSLCDKFGADNVTVSRRMITTHSARGIVALSELFNIVGG